MTEHAYQRLLDSEPKDYAGWLTPQEAQECKDELIRLALYLRPLTGAIYDSLPYEEQKKYADRDWRGRLRRPTFRTVNWINCVAKGVWADRSVEIERSWRAKAIERAIDARRNAGWDTGPRDNYLIPPNGAKGPDGGAWPILARPDEFHERTWDGLNHRGAGFTK